MTGEGERSDYFILIFGIIVQTYITKNSSKNIFAAVLI